MSKKIIALQGVASSGKTTTISLLPNILLNNGFSQVPNMRQNHGADFLDIFENKKIRVGVTSSGDSFDLVNDRLTDLVNANCDICICACRTYDRIPPGTVAATQNFPGYQTEYIRKTYVEDENQYVIVNQNDANSIFNRI